LRFAILSNGESLERWQASALEHLLADEDVELVAVVVVERAGGPARPSAPLSRLYARRLQRRQLRATVGLPEAATRIPRIRVGRDLRALSDANAATLRRLELDFVLSLGIDPLTGPILDIPRHGVWAFDFDRDWTERVGLGDVRRLLTNETVSALALLRLTSAFDRAVVLRQGWFRIDDQDPWRGFARAREESAKWPALVCAALRRGEPDRLDGPAVAVRPTAHRFPGSLQIVRLVALVVQNRLRFAWGRLFRHPQWNIGIVDQPIHELLRAKSHPPARWFPLNGRRGFFADPFGARRGDAATILCEYYDYHRGKGTIWSIGISGGEFTSSPQPALELPLHTSYPCLVEDEGAFYCIPETHQTREVGLFKADSFPRRWTEVGTLVRGVSAIDPTVFRYAGCWWLTCTDHDAGEDTNLLVWYALRLEGPWTPHTANPVKIDIRSTRPAGTPFEHEGRLYRPAQDCSRAYGGRIVINQVTRLTPDEFAEEPVATIEPTADSPYPAGRHTLSALGDMTLIDGHRFVFVPVAFRHFVRTWGLDMLSVATRKRRSRRI
jgi:hypothetical protein